MNESAVEREPLLTTRQVAEFLGVNIVTVRRMIASRNPNEHLPAIRVGWQLRVHQADLDAYLERHRR